jgi:DNA end-binding protein Ku
MNLRPSWDGSLRFSLITVPVKAYSATKGANTNIGFNLLHKGCNSRIRYKKVCPIHGEVQQSEIVSGYEYSKGKYVVVDAEEIGKLRPESDKSINIDTFVDVDAVDALYFSGRTYYLLPSGKGADKPYSVLQSVMESKRRMGVAEVVLSGREHLAIVRGSDDLLILSLLSYAEQLRTPADFEGEVSHPKITAEERKLAETLIEASTRDEFDLSAYRDDYESKLRKLVDAKIKGKKIVAPPSREAPRVINLMDALKKSLKQVPASAAHRKTSRRSAKAPPASKRRKTG